MSDSLESLFQDCHRRAGIQAQREGAADLARLWAGLGFPSQFKGKARQFFEPIGAETPRVLNWYRLTEAGRAEYLARFEGKPGFFEKAESV